MATETTHSVRPPQFSVSFSSELAAVPPYTVASIKLTATNSIRPPKSSSDLASKREMKPSASETETSDSFVAVDIDELSQQLMANIKDRSSSTPRVVSVYMFLTFLFSLISCRFRRRFDSSELVSEDDEEESFKKRITRQRRRAREE